jgi:hypothetical protein
MKYYQYFDLFLNVEDDLLAYIQQLEYSKKSRHIYSPRLALLLLQTCPIIESFMVRVATVSERVRAHEIYDWKFNWKIWKKKKYEDKVAEKNTARSIETFAKFAYVFEVTFKMIKSTVKRSREFT